MRSISLLVTRFLFLVIAMMLIPALAFGNPFLTADPQTGVDEYRVVLDGADQGLFPAKDMGDGTVVLWYDLAGVPDGAHTVQAAAKNVWGESALSDPFDFTKAVPGAPTGLRVSSE